MTLRNDLIKHTIFLQKYAQKEKRMLIKDLKELAEFAKLFNDKYTTLSSRKKNILNKAVKMTGSDRLDQLFEYEKKFIKKLLLKYEKNNSQ